MAINQVKVVMGPKDICGNDRGKECGPVAVATAASATRTTTAVVAALDNIVCPVVNVN